METRLRVGQSGFDSRQGLGIFLFATAVSRPALGPTQQPIQWMPEALSSGVKWLGREADHSLPSTAEVKNAWSYTSAPPIRVRMYSAQPVLQTMCSERSIRSYGTAGHSSIDCSLTVAPGD
jgi:hypothetical protein